MFAQGIALCMQTPLTLSPVAGAMINVLSIKVLTEVAKAIRKDILPPAICYICKEHYWHLKHIDPSGYTMFEFLSGRYDYEGGDFSYKGSYNDNSCDVSNGGRGGYILSGGLGGKRYFLICSRIRIGLKK